MKLLIANRGEIAVRIIRTCRDLGIASVVGYCDFERDAQYVLLADEAYALGENANAFMDGDAFLAIAKRAGATAIHPGYGFLSESAEFAQAVQNAGLIWVGPESSALKALGDKASARAVAASVNVNPVPGCEHAELTNANVEEFIAVHGYPVVIKKLTAAADTESR
ncbi:biotin carboxylase N-terminal domain-containing protein [Arcanobacterium hippocoleae]